MTQEISTTISGVIAIDHQAEQIIEALSFILRDETGGDKVEHGGLWRLRMSLLELQNGLRSVRDDYGTRIMNATPRKLAGVVDAIALVAADASPSDPNRAALDRITSKIAVAI